jgi:aquaglyceroporin related protein
MLGFLVSKKSGGHINPAVTFCNCLYRGLPWRKFPVYFMGQLLGAMAGAFIVYGNYYHAINHFEGGVGIRTVTGPTATAGIFCTYPAEFMTREGMWWSEFIASAILMFVIFGLADPKNGATGNHFAIALLFLIFGIGACFGWQTGYAINLARDFGPRLVTYILGYGHEVWSAGGYYFWVSLVVAVLGEVRLLTSYIQIPMVAPFFGTMFGGFLYDTFLYTGESPINTPWFGLKRFLHPTRQVWSNSKV